MEKSQYKLCLEVFRRLHAKGMLDGLILIGSWCLLFYRDYFGAKNYRAAVRTRDLDFLIPLPQRFSSSVDLHDLLSDLGFVVNFKGDGGWITFQHPDLILEFLTPLRGRGASAPVPVPALGINAQRLRFLDLLAGDTIQVQFEEIPVRVPHPAAFALHKLIIAPRRKSEKMDRDREQAITVLHALVESGELSAIRDRFCKLPVSWREPIRAALALARENDLLAALDG